MTKREPTPSIGLGAATIDGASSSGQASDEPIVVGAPPDPRDVIDDLQLRLQLEQEKSLNALDAVLGAQAAAAQAKAETREVFHRLHVREQELTQLKELLAQLGGDPFDDGGAPPVDRPNNGDLGPMARDLAREAANNAAGRLQRLRSGMPKQ
jgi:hypothetical protein